jgi:hypothetical protein
VINVEKAQIIKLSPANLLNSPLETTFGENLAVITIGQPVFIEIPYKLFNA